MRRITLDYIITSESFTDYTQLYQFILEKLQEERWKPVKASGKNGKTPALYKEYWVVEEAIDYSAYEHELNYELHPTISTDYYKKHLSQYVEDRRDVLLLHEYLCGQDRIWTNSQNLPAISVNERSFSIWGREKFLTNGEGKKLLKHCGLEMDDLQIYHTAEPFAYYCHTRSTPQNILIVENKDTFYSIRKYFMSQENSAKLFGIEFGSIIYGAGKGVVRQMEAFEDSAEPYMMHPDNVFFYFGDLDYEGIGIYESLAKRIPSFLHLKPFKESYLLMLEKAREKGLDFLPITKEKQNRKINGDFFSCFLPKEQEIIKALLETQRYIPQEIINIGDLVQR